MNGELFAHVQEFPDPDSGDRFDALVGLDAVKLRLVNEARVLLDPEVLTNWANRHYPHPICTVSAVRGRTALVVLAGDVGTGKTEIAETVGHPVSRALKIPITLYSLSLSTRGSGLVGEMTALITQALTKIRTLAQNASTSAGSLNRALILLIDEADSVAQSRELAQMHHEDRVGVNALIQGIDGFRTDRLQVLTILCTNRPDALDPAVARRAAHIFVFSRPDENQRRHILTEALCDADIPDATIDELVSLLGPNNARPYGVTYSDIRQRFLPDAVFDALGADIPLKPERLLEIAGAFSPTRPFSGNTST